MLKLTSGINPTNLFLLHKTNIFKEVFCFNLDYFIAIALFSYFSKWSSLAAKIRKWRKQSLVGSNSRVNFIFLLKKIFRQTFKNMVMHKTSVLLTLRWAVYAPEDWLNWTLIKEKIQTYLHLKLSDKKNENSLYFSYTFIFIYQETFLSPL